MGTADVALGEPAAGGGLVGVRPDTVQRADGVVVPRLGPRRAGRVDVLQAGRYPTGIERDEEAVVGGHEVEIAGVPGGDDRPAPGHRLGRREPEPLGPVERDGAVGVPDEVGDLVVGEVAVEQDDVATTADRLLQRPPAGRVPGGVQDLQDEDRTLARREGIAEGPDHAEPVLAGGHRTEIEHREERERVRQAELVAGSAGAPGAVGDGQGDGDDRLVRPAGQRVADEPARRPQLVDVRECGDVAGRELLEFPEPDADGVAAEPQLGAGHRRERREHIRVEDEQVRVVDEPVGHLGGVGDDRRPVAPVRERGRLDPGAVSGGQVAPPGVADAAGRVEQADDVEPPPDRPRQVWRRPVERVGSGDRRPRPGRADPLDAAIGHGGAPPAGRVEGGTRRRRDEVAVTVVAFLVGVPVGALAPVAGVVTGQRPGAADRVERQPADGHDRRP